MGEPSVLDYLKTKLMPWKGIQIELPPAETPADARTGVAQPVHPQPAEAAEHEVEMEGIFTSAAAVEAGPSEELQTVQAEAVALARRPIMPPSRTVVWPAGIAWPWRSLAALLLAMAAQVSFAPPARAAALGSGLLLLAVGLAVWALARGEWRLAPPPPAESRLDPLTVNSGAFAAGAILAGLTFLATSGNRFTAFNLLLLALSLFFLFRAFWLAAPRLRPWVSHALGFIARPIWTPTISLWTLLVLASVLLVAFFRFYRLDAVPPEMVSDHAEKYLDVGDILNGRLGIFFPRNGGREVLQFYLLAALHTVFGAPLNHLTLKISTALIGFLALPFVYLIGKEVANRRVGLLAFTFAGIAYWTNVVSRAGMRLPFYFLFTGAVLYFLLRGLRTSNRNDFLLAGLALGLGFYGYSADRILPLLVVTAVGIYLLHRQSQGQRKQVILWTLILALIAFVVFLPLLRYITQDPQGFTQRMFSRMGAAEQDVAGPAIQVFLANTWNALKMFSWSAGIIWVVSIPEYPALGVITGALFYLGAALLLARWARRRHWQDLFLLIAVPLLLLPSILSLAYPGENPNLYRTGGAMVPVFLMVALAAEGLMAAFERRIGGRAGELAGWGVAILLVGVSAMQDYDWLFNRYYEQYRESAWNYSEVGEVIHEFSSTLGSPETAWVMGYPHWLDTRLVAIEAGYPEREYAVFPDGVPATTQDPRPKLFILNPQDQLGLDTLRQVYPQGWTQTWVSRVPTKDFLMYFVPPQNP